MLKDQGNDGVLPNKELQAETDKICKMFGTVV